MTEEPKPAEIVAVGAICHPDNAGPNRKQRRTAYHELGSIPLKEHKKPVKVLNNKLTGVILFVMPDDRVYEVNPKMVIQQIYSHWSQPKAVASANEPGTEAEPV